MLHRQPTKRRGVAKVEDSQRRGVADNLRQLFNSTTNRPNVAWRGVAHTPRLSLIPSIHCLFHRSIYSGAIFPGTFWSPRHTNCYRLPQYSEPKADCIRGRPCTNRSIINQIMKRFCDTFFKTGSCWLPEQKSRAWNFRSSSLSLSSPLGGDKLFIGHFAREAVVCSSSKDAD